MCPPFLHHLEQARTTDHAMPPAPLVGNAVTGGCDQEGARRAHTVPAAAGAERIGSTAAKFRGRRLPRIAGLLRPMPKTSASDYDPVFERPDLIEDDYYRLRNQPRG